MTHHATHARTPKYIAIMSQSRAAIPASAMESVPLVDEYAYTVKDIQPHRATPRLIFAGPIRYLQHSAVLARSWQRPRPSIRVVGSCHPDERSSATSRPPRQ